METALCGVHIVLNVVDNYKPKLVNKDYADQANSDIRMLRNDTGSFHNFIHRGLWLYPIGEPKVKRPLQIPSNKNILHHPMISGV